MPPSNDALLTFPASRTINASVACEHCVRKADQCLLSTDSRPEFKFDDIYRIEESASRGCPLCAAVMYGFNEMKERYPNQQILDKAERRDVGYQFTPTNAEDASHDLSESLLDEIAGPLDGTRQHLSVSALGASRPGIHEFYASITLVKLRGMNSS